MAGAEPGRRSTPLHELAAHVGIIPEYVDLSGVTRTTSDETRRALLAALGIDATTDDGARAALARARAGARAEMIPPVHVVRAADPSASWLVVRVPAHASAGRWRLDLKPEQGEPTRLEGPWRGDDRVELRLPVLFPGYHRARVSLNANGREAVNEQMLIVVPSKCVSPAEILGDRRAVGLTTNLYTVRSATNWGVGDFTDLRTLAAWGASAGADFVGVNPLHALMNRGPDVGPYSPVSRIFRNPIYVDVARVPELQFAPEARDWIASPALSSDIEALRASPTVRYDRVMRVKGQVLAALHRAFVEHIQGTGHPRDRAYERYVAEQDPALTRFAAWMTMAEQHGREWRAWPAELRDAGTFAARQFADVNAGRVDYHRWLQFETDRQLSEASRSAREAGMRIGLYQDLAIGTSDAGADTWAFPDLFVPDATIGAPPDPYAATGQNWQLPPIDPRALRRQRYEYFIKLLRGGFRHGGALRIDHVMGLFRLFWIPQGASAVDGAYVRYPADDLLGILALESSRHRAIVVGEDLGTVPPDVPPALARWGVLSSKVLYFEREPDGQFKPPHAYPSQSLATVNTHDMPTIAGFWQGVDIDTRVAVGLLQTPDAVNEARAERQHERVALVHRLAVERLLPNEQPPASQTELCAAVHGFLCRTPAVLVGLSLDDLAGELEAVNVPGVGPDRHESWTRKMHLPVERIATSEAVRAALPMAALVN